ncbi:LOB domain-containing protein 22-like [Malania oleifera]|uniref:LOB domain-containing protein 22-like n=1 Tax=Malania oleifera TaxID=397392 RepID=UPI0025ADF8D2|nr:LOB domain-containing protein 22-like [Malania oleifera]
MSTTTSTITNLSTTTPTNTNNINNAPKITPSLVDCSNFTSNHNLPHSLFIQNEQQQPQACAACKHQRRKCAPDCLLRPYFPHDRQRQFLNAHKLFGVSNIGKIIRPLSPTHRDLAMRTIIFQSDARASDPVGGCLHIVRDLQRRIDLATAELRLVLHNLALCRAHHQAQISVLENNATAVPQPPQHEHDELQEHEEEEAVVDHNYSSNDDEKRNANGNFSVGGYIGVQHSSSHHLQDLCSWLMQDSVSSSPTSSPPPPSSHVKQIKFVDSRYVRAQ